MKRETIDVNYLSVICWVGDAIVDWASAGKIHSPDGQNKQLGKYHFPFKFDSSISSSNGQYAFIYQKLGTKGLLLKNGELLREINRSYYCANVYEYPVTFGTINGITYLIHCPAEYNRLEFEDAETGIIVTDIPEREPSDIFHSRLEVDEDNKHLLSKGWVWHPLDVVEIFNLEDCLNNPLLLDNSSLHLVAGVEVCTASFINSSKILVGSSDEILNNDCITLPPKHIAIWDLQSNQVIDAVKINGAFGNLVAINETVAWDLLDFPKIINIKTGEVVDKDESVYSGKQASSIVGSDDKIPQIAFNRLTKQLAIINNDKIQVLTPF